jgi:hypothetical protein
MFSLTLKRLEAFPKSGVGDLPQPDLGPPPSLRSTVGGKWPRRPRSRLERLRPRRIRGTPGFRLPTQPVAQRSWSLVSWCRAYSREKIYTPPLALRAQGKGKEGTHGATERRPR